MACHYLMWSSFPLAQVVHAGFAFGLSSSPPKGGPIPIEARGDDGFDPYDLSNIKDIAAIGDSYSAGIGAGERLGQLISIDPAAVGAWKCSRYDHSYPYLVNWAINGNNTDNFDFHSCSGAVVQEIIDEQVHRIRGERDAIMISGGGNDAELVWVLNQCIYQVLSPHRDIMDRLKLWANEQFKKLTGYNSTLLEVVEDPTYRGHIVRSCDEQLQKTRELIDDPAFSDRVGTLIDKAKEKLKKDGIIYYTGYAQFFDTDIEDNDFCSKPENSWSVLASYYIGDGLILQGRADLTKERRQRLNELVVHTNDVLREVVAQKSEGDTKVVFVDYDPYFGAFNARFCTKGVNKREQDRVHDLGFYPLNIKEAFGTKPFKPDDATPGTVADHTWEYDINLLAEAAREGKVEYKKEYPGASSRKAQVAALSDISLSGNDTQGDILTGRRNRTASLWRRDPIEPDLTKRTSIIADGVGRVFHPTVQGHGWIANLVLWHMKDRNARSHGKTRSPEQETMQYDTCPMPQVKKPRDLICLKKTWGAPKERSDEGSTIALHAIREFCAKRDGQEIEKGVEGKGERRIYDRWDISSWGVPKRHSLWISAMPGPFNQCSKGKVIRSDCEKVLIGGMQFCDAGEPFTYGMKAQGEGCMEYSIDISVSVKEGDPPWNEHVTGYPPPETVYSYLYPATGKRPIDCTTAIGEEWKIEDANKGIDEFCGNDKPMRGLQPEWTLNSGTLNFSASIDHNITDKEGHPNQFWPTPYEDPSWCMGGWDPKHKDQDDCRYAFRKIVHERLGEHMACFFTYRCVTYFVATFPKYMSQGIEISDDPVKDPEVPSWKPGVDAKTNKASLGDAEGVGTQKASQWNSTTRLNSTAGWNAPSQVDATALTDMSDPGGRPHCIGALAPLLSECRDGNLW